jgi:ribose-phosphate pyrophosphokinase
MPMLLGFDEYEAQAQRLATALDQSYARVAVHRFPDGESKVTLPAELPEHVVICRSLDRPNEKLIELLLTATTARRLGASRLTLVAPYLCYMRQDTAFNAGEAISQSIIGRFLADLFDDVITVDPHLHRTHHLKDAIPASHAVALSAAPAMSEFLLTHPDTLLLGPDAESEQWVRSIAEHSRLDYAVASKYRLGDCEVRIELPEVEMRQKSIVIIDDVISSGETIAMAAQQCLTRDAKRVDVLVTHPLFATGAIERLQQAGVGEIWSSDSIPHPSNCIPLAELLAEAVRAIA